MCEPEALGAVRLSDYEQMPEKIHSADPLLNVGKKELEIALRMAYSHDWVADWLFSQSSQIFHPRTAPIPPEAFDNSLAIHLRHDISTPASCPRGPTPIGRPVERISKKEEKAALTITKDIDLLLVPVLNVDGITAGYSFLKGVQESSMTPSGMSSGISSTEQSPAEFISGRFAFNIATRDFLMVVNSMSPHMTGIVSMRWRDKESRDRSFFAIPKADYGPGRLPSRVLSLQCNVEYEVAQPVKPEFQFLSHDDENSCSTTLDESSSPQSSTQGECAIRHQRILEYEGVRDDDVLDADDRDFAYMGDSEDEAYVGTGAFDGPGDSVAFGENRKVGAVPVQELDPLFAIENALGDGDNWAEGLKSIGTVIAPFDDPNGVLPEFLQDLTTNSNYMEDIERILAGASDILTTSNTSMDGGVKRSLEHKRSEKEAFAFSSAQMLSASSYNYGFNTDVPEENSSWIFSGLGSTPDGVGIPRRPAKNDTSSGSFDMSTLIGSLATIERSLKGQFFGPKVRKDVLHPQTGELISRCTGVVNANINSVTPGDMFLLRNIAAQAYYASRMSISNDACLIAAAPDLSGSVISTPAANSLRTPEDEPRRKQGRLGPQKRPTPAPLAPRPIARIALPPGLSHPEVLQLDKPVGSAPDTAVVDEKAAREAKLEAKRIKNRLSAARSNQKRRVQLEERKKELATLRERVEELKSKQKMATEENETLKQKVASKA